MLDKDDQLIDDILKKILTSSPGIRYVILMDRNGFTISYSAKFVSSNHALPIERLGAIGGAVYSAIEEQGACINYNDVDSLAVGYKKGYIFSISAGEGILSAITDKNINQGMISNVMKRYRGMLAKILGRYLQQDQSEEISEELKSLLSESDLDIA